MSDLKALDSFLVEPLDDANGILARFGYLAGASRQGECSEQYVYVPGRRPDRVLLVAHADTYWDKHYHRITTWTGIGADDRAGCAILWLLRGLGHSLLVTHGEEQGHQGSNALMHDHAMADEIQNHQFALEFDRQVTGQFKCYDVGTDTFRAYVQNMTGYCEPDRTSSTDICVLCRDICGANFSVGYFHEHTPREGIDRTDWQRTLKLGREWLSRPNLPKFPLRLEGE